MPYYEAKNNFCEIFYVDVLRLYVYYYEIVISITLLQVQKSVLYNSWDFKSNFINFNPI